MASDQEQVSDTGNWNVAQGYIQEKIMKPLAELDKYELIARFGSSELIEQFIKNEEQKAHARIMALEWMHTTLLMLINNTYFAVRRKEDRELLLEFKGILGKIEGHFGRVAATRYNHRNHLKALDIQETEFRMILDILLEIKTKVNEPLNRADLIFKYEEAFDPRKYKTDIKKRLTSQS